MSLTRRVLTPSTQLINTLTEEQLKSYIPTGYRWFQPINLEGDKAAGQILRAMIKTVSPFIVATEQMKYNNTLETATDVLLDLLGQGYGINRQFAELDDDYAVRIQQELLIERITKPAILAGLLRLVPHAEVFEPWKNLAKPSENFIPSGDTYLGSPLYWNAAVFDVIIYPTRGEVPGVENFLQVMKAYGVKHWITFHHPDQFLDYHHDDPLIPDNTADVLPNGAQDPRTSKQNQLVVVGNTVLETNDFAGPVYEGMMPSTPEGMASETFYPSGMEILYFTLDIVNDHFSIVQTPIMCGDIIRVAALDRHSPVFSTLESNGFVIDGSFNLSNLSKNCIIETDMIASEAQGQHVYNITRSEFLCGSVYTEIQAGAAVLQTISLGDPNTIGDGTTFGTIVDS